MMPEKSGWQMDTWDGGNHAHVHPLNDLVEHTFNDQGECACGPRIEAITQKTGSIGWMISHNSLDGRERYEPKENHA